MPVEIERCRGINITEPGAAYDTEKAFDTMFDGKPMIEGWNQGAKLDTSYASFAFTRR